MRTRRVLAELALAACAAALVLLVAPTRQPGRAAEPESPVSWQGLVGDGPRVPVQVGQRMIVVLKWPSLADRVAANGGVATQKQENSWTNSVLAQERLLRSRLELQGVEIHPEFTFSRVLSGFSAPLDATAIALLERDNAVQGIYPVRVAYPSSISSDALLQRPLGSSVGNARMALPGFDGRGVTIALLDTGVDRSQPSLVGSLGTGIDVVDPTGDSTPQAAPGSPADVERHGTELAGILVADRGPPAANGLARGASVLPIRIAGWQPDGRGGFAVYSRTDQLIEGLERAVDPNDDGDAHDAARVALVGVAAPYAAFADDPAARAVSGARALNTLVVAPAGNDGPAGPGFGSISGPGGAPAALTVGAADTRAQTQHVHVTLRSGLRLLLDRDLPLTGELTAQRPITSPVAAPGLFRKRASFSQLGSFFTKDGLSFVAGRAALVPSGSSPAETARAAAEAGATAVLLYGSALPAGGVALDERTPVPVVSIRAVVAARVLAAISHGRDAEVSIGVAHDTESAGGPSVAAFSSTGLAYDARVKPDIVASGVSVATAEPASEGVAAPAYGTVNGSSAAAAAVAGGAAVLAEARPTLDAAQLESVLVGSAQRLPDESVTSQGAGLVSLGGAAAAELAAEPATLAFGNASTTPTKRWQSVVVRNISTRPLRVRVRFAPYNQGAAAVELHAVPAQFVIRRGKERRVRLALTIRNAPVGTTPAEGSIVLEPSAGDALRLPWVVTFTQPPTTVLGQVRLSTDSFTPSDAGPALLTFRAGQIVTEDGRDAVQPVALLRLDLLDETGTLIGTLVTLRDLLPGRYAFGLTGRTPVGNTLTPGRYRIRVTAVPSFTTTPSQSEVAFTIK